MEKTELQPKKFDHIDLAPTSVRIDSIGLHTKEYEEELTQLIYSHFLNLTDWDEPEVSYLIEQVNKVARKGPDSTIAATSLMIESAKKAGIMEQLVLDLHVFDMEREYYGMAGDENIKKGLKNIIEKVVSTGKLDNHMALHGLIPIMQHQFVPVIGKLMYVSHIIAFFEELGLTRADYDEAVKDSQEQQAQ